MTINQIGLRQRVEGSLRLTLVFGIGVLLVAQAAAQTLTTVWDNGPSDNRVDLIFIGDGYTVSEVNSAYPTHVQEELDYLFSGAFRNPFPRYRKFFNAHRVNVISNESGADQPPNNIFRDTALDASYWWGGSVERCLYLNTTKANQAVNVALQGSGIDVDARFGLVNDSKYGGCGGSWAVYAAENSVAADIGVHELGHSLGNLADEYWSNGTSYTGAEPSAVNLTRSPNSGKWDRWVGYVDPETNIGVIDYYEGGGYNQFGLFRPSVNSEMRSLNRPFDAISREQFIARFYAEVDPLDAWLANSTPIQNPEQLWVDSVDPDVIQVEWFVNGDSIGNQGESLDIGSLGLLPGSHVIQARAYDGILDHSFTGSNLDWWRRSDTTALQQTIQWDIEIDRVGDFDNNGVYDCDDINNLSIQIALQADLTFDLNGDGVLDPADVDAWLAIAGAAQLPSGQPYLRGDGNLDGLVDVSDFNIWNVSKYSQTPLWCLGDYNTDGVVDGSDFNVWNSHKFTAADSNAAVSTVPEPSSVWLMLMGVGGVVLRRRVG